MKIYLTSLLAIGMAISAAAAVNFPFDVKTPTWTKIAQGTAENGANIRKAPSATAPRLMYDEYRIELDCPVIPQSQWSTRPVKGTWYAATFDADASAPVLAEKDGWVQLDFSCPELGPCWVSSKYCSITNIKPITRNNAGVYVKFLDGDKSDYFIKVESNEMEGCIDYYVGKLVNGMLISKYIFCTEWKSSENINQARIVHKTDGTMSETYWHSFLDGSYDDLDASKLTPEMINQILKYAEPIEYGNVATYMTPSEDLDTVTL